MLFVSRVKLRNFKSFRFADIPLAKGFNCLAGPNGSGKSNIVDGLRFAFGELSLKSLRAKRIPDLITIGSEKAEITIFLDGEKKYEVKRAIRGDGKTLYKLNGKRTTRTAILDVLRPHGLEESGHNVIAQGEVQRFIDMNAKERREIIDRVAGISEFEEKKKESLTELGKVEQKINDATIVMREREGLLTELEKERDDALKYKEASDSLRVSKASLLHQELKRADSEHTKVSEKYLKMKAEEEAVRKASEELNRRITELEEKKFAIVKEINEKAEREKSGLAQQVQDLQTQVSVAKATASQKAKEVGQTKERQKSLSGEKKDLEEKLAKFDSSSADLNSQLSALESSIASFMKEKNIALKDAEDLGKHFGEIKRKAADLGKKLEEKRSSQAVLEIDIEKLKTRKQLLEAELAKSQSSPTSPSENRRKELLSQLSALREEAASIDKQLESLFSQEKELNRKLPEAEKRFLEARDKYTTVAAKLSAHRESPEQQAVSAILDLKERGMLLGVHGTVGELCKFSDDAAIAIEAAAGPRLNFIIVDSADVASKAIDYLKQRKMGRCTFIPLDKKPFTLSEEARILAKKDGSSGFLIDFVQFAPALSPAYQYAFGDTLLVDSINAAKKIGIGKIRMVTPEGDLLESSGVITGGTFHKKPGALREKAEADRLRAEADSMKAERDSITESLYSLRDEMGRRRKERADAEVRQKSCEIELRHLDESEAKERESLESGRKAAEEARKRIAEIGADLAGRNSLLEKLTGELSNLSAQLSVLQGELAKEAEDGHRRKMTEAETQLGDLNASKSKLDAKLAGLKAEADVHRQRLSSISNESSQLKKDLSSVEKEIEGLDADTLKASKQLEERMAKVKSVGGELDKLYSQRNELEGKIEELAKERGRKGYNVERFIKDFARQEADKAVLEQRLSDLKAELASYSGVTPIEGAREEFDAKIKESELAIQSLGNVNLRAPEIYEEKKRGIMEMKEQVGKLAEERLAIVKMIEEIDSRKKDVFMEAFYKLNENFRRLYSKIMTGEATFILEDPADIFKSGLSVKVKDGEERDKYLEAMSGGEKALIALLFVFSIQMYRPAPFYIFDEADAALDKVNSRKLCDLLQQLSKGTQFIVVTHNDTVLSSADIALGVMKTTEGSRIVGIELTKAAAG